MTVLKQYVPATGPFWLYYTTSATGAMLSISGPGITLSGAALGRGFAIGWWFPRLRFRDRTYKLGRER